MRPDPNSHVIHRRRWSRRHRADGQREFSISTLYRGNRNTQDGRVPYIRLSGQWLEAFGFMRGERVLIAAEQGRLVVTLAPPQPAIEAPRITHPGVRPCKPRLALAIMRRRLREFRPRVA